MRILLVTNIFPPIIGGPATFIDGLAHELSSRGDDVTVVCSSEGAAEQEDAERPFRVIRCDIRNRYLYEVRVRVVLARELASHRTVLVNGLETYVAPIARRLRRRYVLKVVGDPVWETARNQGLTVLPFDEFQAQAAAADARTRQASVVRGRYLAQASTIVTPSDFLGDVVAGWGAQRERLLTIPNGAVLGPVPEPPARPAGTQLDAVFVGRLTNWKGVETAVLAVRDVPDVHVTIIGSGPEAPLLETLTAQLGLSDRVTFAGRMSHAATSARVARAHVLLLPSCYEGLSHTLLEAGERAVPVIASDIGGNRALVTDGVDGLLVPYADPAALATALRALRDDEEQRRRLGRALRQTVERHSFDTTTSAFAALLRREA